MGDRTNLVIRGSRAGNAEKMGGGEATLAQALDGAIVVYGHWSGHDAGPKLAAGLVAARGRWTDDAYGARIIASHFIGDQWRQETGYGLLAGELGDNERAVLVVNFADKTVRRFGDPGEYLPPDGAEAAKETGRWTFAEFAAFTEKQAREAHIGHE